MKKGKYIRALFYALIILSAIKMSPAYSQGMINNGAYIVNSGAYIVVTGATGNYTNQDAGASIGRVNNTGFIQVAGNWTNNSVQNVFTANTGTVEMNGTNQVFGGSTVTWFNNLTLLGTGNKTLNQDELAGGGYATPAGILALNDRPLVLLTSKMTVNNPLNAAITRTTGYIVSEMNAGTNTAILQWNVGATNAAYVFPFGTLTAPALYIPLTITKSAGNTNILASTRMTSGSNNTPWESSVSQMYSMTIPGAGEVPVVIDRWWDINSTSGFTGGVDFTYRGVENTTTYAPSGTFAAQNWIGTSWNPPVGAGPGVAAGTAVVTIPAQGLGSTTPWVLSNLSAPLPVELLYFAAKKKEKSVLLDWSTSSEINNAYFEIQRSKDNENFETIDVREGAGNSTSVLIYNDVDVHPYEGLSFYRLKQVDYDGKFSFSPSVAVRFENADAFNFVFASSGEKKGAAVIGYESNSAEELSVRISDVRGKQVSNIVIYPSLGFNKSEITFPELSAGIYLITLTNSSVVSTKKLFIN
ncbi:MAG: T9SS type A sorting domain-containing protein [Bacteroidota bacterium]